MQHTMWFSTEVSPYAADLHQVVVAHLRDWVDEAKNDAAAVTLLTSHLDTSELNFGAQPNMRLMVSIFATFHFDTSESNKGELPNALSALVTLLTFQLLKSALKSALVRKVEEENSMNQIAINVSSNAYSNTALTGRKKMENGDEKKKIIPPF